MEAALRGANWLLGKVLQKLADDLVEAYVASSELAAGYERIKTDLMYTQGLLHEAAGGAASAADNPGLQGLLQQLSNKADEAEDALDELHYFAIQDQLDGTREAAPEVADDCDVIGLRRRALHARHTLRHTAGKWLACFSSPRSQDGDSSPAVAGKLPFDRVAMSSKIKSVMEGIHTQSALVSSLLKISHGGSSHKPGKVATLKRPLTASAIAGEHKLYGRGATLDQIIAGMANGSYHSETIYVLPIVGPGGIGKTTLAKHLYNDRLMESCFSLKVWVCVPTKFDVLKLTQEILRCICMAQNEENISTNETTNLDQLQKFIARKLKYKRILIVLDDVWSCSSGKDWENLLAPFKTGETDGNMVIFTTRFPSIAQMVKTAATIELQGLEPDDFFKLFESCVFEEDKLEHYEQDLMDIAQKIANNLKGSPLAANTVGRLLKKDISQEHWIKVLENHEWQNQQSGDDIMPSLKISYDYLPFNLKKCFPYFSLFPENYRFDNLEMTRFWTSIGMIDSSVHGDNNYLEELVDNGFLIKAHDDLHEYYVLHGLLHELARSVASQECVNISSFSFRAQDIQPSIHHLSITINDEYDITFEGEMDKLRRRVDIANLRTLVVIGEYKARVYGILKDILKETKRLRVLFFIMDSPQSLPHNLSKLIHLRYLKIESPYGIKISLPSTLSRFYHLKFLDLEYWHGSHNLPRDISNLVNLHNFLGGRELHSNVPEVGKMKCLQELKEFCVKKENVGFELRELGELTQLGGQLTIRNLERVATMREANGANLMLKKNLKELTLVWCTAQQATGSEDILDGLQPHPNVRSLKIINHGGATGPSWLCSDIRIKKLESLHLDGVSWGILPPFEQLLHLTELNLKNISGIHQFGPDFGGVTDKSFMHLKRVTFQHMRELVEWVGGANLHLFARLESIECRDCPNLCRLPFSQLSGHCRQDNVDTIWFPNLSRLWIVECPKLSLPPLPHTPTLTYVCVQQDGEIKLSYLEKELIVDGYGGALAFHNLDKVEIMKVKDVSHISLSDLQMLKSLKRLNVSRCSSMFSGGSPGGSGTGSSTVVLHSVQSLSIEGCHLTGKSLRRSFDRLPALSELDIAGPVIDGNGDEEEEGEGEGEELVLRLPSSSSLLKLSISHGGNLVLPVEAAGSGWPGGLTSSLRSLTIQNCGRIFSRWSSSTSMADADAGAAAGAHPLPSSLRELDVSGEVSMHGMGLLSNLSSLTQLRLVRCDNLTLDGFEPLAMLNLRKLLVYNTNEEEEEDVPASVSVAAGLLTAVATLKPAIPAGSFRLEELAVDGAAAALSGPICGHLAGTLKRLSLRYDQRVEGFTEEEEAAVQLLAALRWLEFHCCRRLRSLPGGLRRLGSLKRLTICGCPRIQALPGEGLPSSLRILDAWDGVSDSLKDQANKLGEACPNLSVFT